jgi:Dihydroprymidine dehydrogenase domain II, 4Fe-4S cluster
VTEPRPLGPIEEAILAGGEHEPLTQKQRMGLDRVTMPEQDADLRAANFREVNLGLTWQLAMLEAERCLQCPKPYCIDGCPVRVNIPRFIKLLRDGDIAAAAESLLDDNALPCVNASSCACGARRASRSPSAASSGTSPTGRRPTPTNSTTPRPPSEVEPWRSSAQGRPASPPPESWPSSATT